MDWLNFATTHGAKNRIRQWFKKHHREEHIQQGRQMLEAELGRPALEEFLKSEKMKEIGRRLNLTEADDILAAVGYGDLSVLQVVNRVREQEQQENAQRKPFGTGSGQPSKPSNIGSLGGLLHHLAKCCQPVPGEPIIGIVTRGSGIAVHRTDCNNLLAVDEERRMQVDWSVERNSAYPAGLQIECLDRVGIAGDILKKVSDNKINLKDLRVETHKDKKTATIYLILDVLDIDQLTKVSQSISQISDVIRVQRRDHRKKTPTNGTKLTTRSNVTPIKVSRALKKDENVPSKKQANLAE
jgi:(p)ppGpp synthase/HD superfamily hydrolase